MNPSPIPEPTQFTPEISIRTMIGGAALGELIARKFGLDLEFAPLIGGLIGALYDLILFWFKTRTQTPKENP